MTTNDFISDAKYTALDISLILMNNNTSRHPLILMILNKTLFMSIILTKPITLSKTLWRRMKK